MLPALAQAAASSSLTTASQGLAAAAPSPPRRTTSRAIVYNVAGLAEAARAPTCSVDLNLARPAATRSPARHYPDDTTSIRRRAGDPAVERAALPRGREPDGAPTAAGDRRRERLRPADASPSPLGVYGPSSVGTSSFPDTVRAAVGAIDAPGPQRFDLVDENILVRSPTLAVAWRPLRLALPRAAPSSRRWRTSASTSTPMAYTNANQCRCAEAYGVRGQGRRSTSGTSSRPPAS